MWENGTDIYLTGSCWKKSEVGYGFIDLARQNEFMIICKWDIGDRLSLDIGRDVVTIMRDTLFLNCLTLKSSGPKW